MGNQIKFSNKKSKDEPVTGDEEDYLALEIKFIQLKNTNRKLISKIDHQKKLIKSLTSELEGIKNNKQVQSYDKLQNDYHQLKKNYNKLEVMLKKSRAENTKLNVDISDLNKEEDVNDDDITMSRWDKLKNHLPDEVKNLRDSKKS